MTKLIAQIPLTTIPKGQPIRAPFIQDLVRVVNDNAVRLRPPFDPGQGKPEALETTEDLVPDEVWTEINRTVSTVRVEDPDDSETFVDVERIDSVTMRKPNGDTVQLVFDNS